MYKRLQRYLSGVQHALAYPHKVKVGSLLWFIVWDTSKVGSRLITMHSHKICKYIL